MISAEKTRTIRKYDTKCLKCDKKLRVAGLPGSERNYV